MRQNWWKTWWKIDLKKKNFGDSTKFFIYAIIQSSRFRTKRKKPRENRTKNENFHFRLKGVCHTVKRKRKLKVTHINFFPSTGSELSKGRHFRRNFGKTNVFIGCRAIFPPNIRKSLKIVPLNTIFLKIDINRYLWVLVGKLLTRTFRKSHSFDECKARV